MNVAFLFNAQLLTGGLYSHVATRLILGTGALQAANDHMRVSKGDVLASYRVAMSSRPTREQVVEVCRRLYKPRRLNLLIEERSDILFGPSRIYCWVFQGMTALTARHLHEGLVPNLGYIGAMDADFSDRFQLNLFRNSLPEALRLHGTRCWIFYHMGDMEHMDLSAKHLFEEYGFVVDLEDMGARQTIFDNFDGVDHFRRVDDFKRIFSRFDGVDDEAVSTLALLLEEIHPRLLDSLASAARALERAETAEDLAQAALSGRRLLERIADYLFPPQVTKKGERALGPDKHRNRLWAYVETTLVEVGLEDSSIKQRMGNEVDRLFRLFNSSLHPEQVTRDRVESSFRDLVIWVTKAIQLSPTHARQAYLAYEDEIEQFLKEIHNKLPE